jgi:hypothetical protein
MSRRARTVNAVVAVVVVLAPAVAAACPSCISSAYGDRSFNWAYLALLLAPFGIALVVAGVLAWSAGYRPRDLRRLAEAARRWRRRRAPLPNEFHEETT